MPKSNSIVETKQASRYLQQLCKHWSHKFSVEFTPEAGMVPFSDSARVSLVATDAGLSMILEANDEERLTVLEGVVADHLKRFAFREELDVQWTKAV